MKMDAEDLAGKLSKLFYRLADEPALSAETKEVLLDFWREFNCYEQPEDDAE
jgi:hypothetical protein